MLLGLGAGGLALSAIGQVKGMLGEADKASGPWVLVATAHPAKFPETVEPLVGHPIPVPDSLGRLLELPRSVTEVPATLEALADVLR